MDDYKYEMRKKKRGLHCLSHVCGLCGCGYREPPTKKQKRRIVKRALKRRDTIALKYTEHELDSRKPIV